MPQHCDRPRLVGLTLAAATRAARSGCSGGDGDEPAAPPSAAAPSSAAQDAPQEVGADGLPAVFPRRDVPIVDGEVVSVSDGDPGADGEYTVMVYVPGATPSDAVTQAVGLLDARGWNLRTVVATGGDPGVQMLVRPGGDRLILTHTLQQGETALTYSVEMA